ncbi:MAG: hypothetical protein E6Q33_00445 [Neisseriales bacterium]|nr:MAG: hypothetical protein E6Q33_00445 [Neisseriales bacterium]
MPQKKRYYRKLYKWIIAGVNLYSLIVIISFIAVLAYGTIGSYLMRDEFRGIKSLNDSFYYTVVTYSTLGDGNIYPITEKAKYLVITMVVLGFGNFAMFVSVVFYQVVNRIQKVLNKLHGGKLHMKDHVILCGYSVLTELLISKYSKSHIKFIILDNRPHPELLNEENFMFVNVPNRMESLIKANIEFCKAVIATSSLDSENILAAINANKLREEYGAKFKILARVLYEENLEAARRNGADHVISPTLMEATAIIDLL